MTTGRARRFLLILCRQAGLIIILFSILAGASNASAQWRLGVRLVDADTRPQAAGITILGVAIGGPAHQNGLESGDIIYQVNGRSVFTIADVQQAIAASSGQVLLAIRDVRSGQVLSVSVVLQRISRRPVQSWTGPTRPPINLAQNQVNIIAQYLRMSPIPTYPAQITNAEASTTRNQLGQVVPIIRYNPAFLNRLYREHGQWASISVLAHEVAHHFHGDASFYGAFTHSWTKELKADFVSGYVLAKAGASEEQSTRALRSQFSLIGSPTHPDTPKRLAALTAGWRKGKYGP